MKGAPHSRTGVADPGFGGGATAPAFPPALLADGPTELAGRAGAPVLATWRELARTRPPRQAFDPASLSSLPEPARRWLTHAIAPGAPLAQAVVLAMEGRIRLKRWIPFSAVQAEDPAEGYVWAARARIGPISITGFDRYTGQSGEMRWRLFERLPLVSASGADVSRSAACRLALDAVFVPTTFASPAVDWHYDPGRPGVTVAVLRFGGEEQRLRLEVDAAGRLQSVIATRWSNPLGEQWNFHLFGGVLSQEATFEGITIPTVMHAGYFPGTDQWAEGEFFRARITGASYR